ncbi:MAG: DUF3467 domain-containing protein [Bacteroidales bacterium]|nr:DUF3467 domain-containing protein [Bacteroidales bacterium]MDD6897734.1 DUF3467 domain-containing protein [Bacteroidales bacterium]MDY4731078.1 DUF3467 domain-containing protein [Prevotella sp.]
MENNNQNKNQFQLDVTPEVAQGEYANLAIIAHSSSDFVLDFARILPGMPKAAVKSRVILAPEHAKRLLLALQENVVKYERVFGPIKLAQPQEKGTIAPFNINKGEA